MRQIQGYLLPLTGPEDVGGGGGKAPRASLLCRISLDEGSDFTAAPLMRR